VIGASGRKSEENIVIAEIQENDMVERTCIKKTPNA
jgi:hypothetical protein